MTTRMIKIISMVMMSCRMMLLLKTSPEADDGGLGGGGDDMRAADRFFLPPLPTGTTAKYLQISISIYFHIYIQLYSCRHYQQVKTRDANLLEPIYENFMRFTLLAGVFLLIFRCFTLFWCLFARGKTCAGADIHTFCMSDKFFSLPLCTLGAPVGSQVGAENVGEHPKHRVLLLAALSNDVDSEREFGTLNF